MALDVKICGLKTDEAVAATLAGGASHCGFIFFEKSPRHIAIDAAARLVEFIADRAVTVAVTVDASDDALDEIVGRVKPAMLQLHGAESPARVAAVKARFGLPAMKALAIREAVDIEKIAPYIGVADRLLFDAKPPKGSDVPGGHGAVFDWSLLQSLDRSVEYMLSGGLNIGNVADALAHTDPAGLDLSSGVESAPGVKDPDKITAFFAALKQVKTRSSMETAT